MGLVMSEFTKYQDIFCYNGDGEGLIIGNMEARDLLVRGARRKDGECQ